MLQALIYAYSKALILIDTMGCVLQSKMKQKD